MLWWILHEKIGLLFSLVEKLWRNITNLFLKWFHFNFRRQELIKDGMAIKRRYSLACERAQKTLDQIANTRKVNNKYEWARSNNEGDYRELVVFNVHGSLGHSQLSTILYIQELELFSYIIAMGSYVILYSFLISWSASYH